MGINIKMLRDSFEVAKPIAPQVVDYFYDFLWNKYPASRGLFKSVKMESQKKALINSLVFIVDHLDNNDKLVQYLENMGERHVKYGTEAEHYDWVGDSLLSTFAHFFKDAWTKELKQQWATAYGLIAETMLAGAARTKKDGKVRQLKQENHAGNHVAVTLPDSLKHEIRVHIRAQFDALIVEEYAKAIEEVAAEYNAEHVAKILKGAA